MRRTALTLVAAAMMAVVVPFGTGRVAATSVVAADTFGANATFLDDTTVNRAAHFQAIAAEGLTYVRNGLSWDEIQPCDPKLPCSEPPRCPCDADGKFMWGRYDQWWADLATAGLRSDVMLGWSARWASTTPYVDVNNPHPPLLASDFAAYARRVAQHYGRNGDFWSAHPALPAHPITTYEIWNEENTRYWWYSDPTTNGPDPAAYAKVYLAARDAIKAVDPQAVVIVGGLAKVELNPANNGLQNLLDGWMIDTEYATKLMQQPGMLGHVDGLGYHPYGQDPADALRLVRQMRTALRGVGVADADVPLYVNEVGWPIQGGSWTNHPTEAQRADWYRTFAEQLTRAPDCNIRGFVAFEWISPERQPVGHFLDWMGIYNRDASPGRLTGEAYGQTARALQGTALRNVPLCP
jgi:hypothetical protein